jgi:hypothetical protein
MNICILITFVVVKLLTNFGLHRLIFMTVIIYPRHTMYMFFYTRQQNKFLRVNASQLSYLITICIGFNFCMPLFTLFIKKAFKLDFLIILNWNFSSYLEVSYLC